MSILYGDIFVCCEVMEENLGVVVLRLFGVLIDEVILVELLFMSYFMFFECEFFRIFVVGVGFWVNL